MSPNPFTPSYSSGLNTRYMICDKYYISSQEVLIMNMQLVYNVLEDVGLVSSQRAFSAYMDHSESWMSSSLARRRTTMTVENLFRLAVRLDKTIQSTMLAIDETDEEQASLYRQGVSALTHLKSDVMEEINSRVR